MRRDQLHLQAHRLQPPAPVVRARAGLHRDEATGRQLRTPGREPIALQLLDGDHSTRGIHRVNLDDPLRQVDADTCNLAHGLPLSASD